jgi:hypothetical protein
MVGKLLYLLKVGTLSKKVVGKVQTAGLAAFIKAVFSSLVRSFFEYRTYYLYENKLDNENEFEPRIDNYTLKIISAVKEVDDLIADGFDIESYYAGIDALNERIEEGAILFSLFVDRDLAHTSWVALAKMAENTIDTPHFTVVYPKDSFIADSRTNSKYQRLGIYTYVYSRIFSHLREMGISSAKFAVEKDNSPPQEAQIKLGSAIYGELCYTRLFGREFCKEKLY